MAMAEEKQITDELTVAEAVDRFGLKEHVIRHWIKTGRITSWKRAYDDIVMVKPSEIQRVIDSRNTIIRED